uniref:Pyrroline-5-carboxylate reductase n=1 Tax=uncultured Bacteroidota bacterium TaxID=152509 RepID=H5SNX1_9BACT|nr:pyrroline-5-carboxylate reductase [uncultured Bacteroidetes bacterium]
MRAVIVGPGVMGETLAGTFRQRYPAEELILWGPASERRAALARRFNAAEASSSQEVGTADWVFLALKPQKAPTVLPALRPILRPDTLVISVMAGISSSYLAKVLGHARLVRSMPNTPGRIGAGITVWISRGLSSEERLTVQEFFSGLGHAIEVSEESYLDMATALSGTGPAYVFLFMEALVEAGVHMGLPRQLAEDLVVGTVAGAVAYYRQAGRGAALLRQEVTSPGGTTAEALYHLEKAGFRSALSEAVWAAYRRALALHPPLPPSET